LEMRERGDLFYKTRFKKRAIPNLGGYVTDKGPVFKELWEKIETIEGVLDGKKVSLEKSNFDLNERDQAELSDTQEGRDKIEAFQKYEYAGEIDGEEIEPEETERLFSLYTPFAQKRSEEIESLRAEKVAA
jgi:hypothetical protein